MEVFVTLSQEYARMGTLTAALTEVGSYARRGYNMAQILHEAVLPPHAEIYDTTDQFPGTTDPVDVTLNEEGILFRIEHVIDESALTFRREGTYVIIFDAHVTRSSGGSADYLDIWLELNGSPMLRTRTRKVLRDPGEIDEIGIHAVQRLKDGDIVKPKLQVSSVGNGIGLTGSDGDVDKPELPSVNLKVFRISM